MINTTVERRLKREKSTMYLLTIDWPRLLKGLLFAVFAMVVTVGCKPKIGVYTLCEYGDGPFGADWKSRVCLRDTVRDPYGAFWEIMTGGSSDSHASSTLSKRYLNSEVNVRSTLSIPRDGIDGWNDFDLVFFFGHNNSIVTPHGGDDFQYFTNETIGTGPGASSYWQTHTGDVTGLWGWEIPYDYWAERPITNANVHPGSVTYLYEPFTSMLIGGAYDYRGDGPQPYRITADAPVQYADVGKLGSHDLEWLILHGCQAVITANEDGTYNNLALRTFAPTHGRWHIVLGHYHSYYTYQMKPLHTFAYDLLSGVPVQAAYFDTDPTTNSSAIAAESGESPSFDWSSSVMANDAWTNPTPDLDNASVYSMTWIVPAGIFDWLSAVES
jgi:hypothetical protein